MRTAKLVDAKGLIKRATGMLLSVALLLSVGRIGPLSAQADRHSPPATAEPTVGQIAKRATGPSSAPATLTDPRREAVSRLCEGLLSCDTAIDLADCAIPAAEIGALYASVLYDDPALFHVALRLSYATETVRKNSKKPLSDKDNGASTVVIVTTVYPTYTLTGAALAEARTLYRTTIAGILADMEAALGGHPPCEAAIALYLHDTLADRYAYDTRPTGTAIDSQASTTEDSTSKASVAGDAAIKASDPGTTAPNADAYRLFRDGVGICQAYTLAYMALCRAAGLEACFVSSPAMNHAWNHVRIDGVWYHVDVTRDDPIVARGEEAVVTHTRLLRTDAGMNAMGYEGYSCPAGHTCTDRRYEVAAGAEAAPTDGATGTASDASASDGNLAAPPLGVFEEALTPVWTGKALIFVANLHGESTVEARSRHGGFCGENAIFGVFEGVAATSSRGTAAGDPHLSAVAPSPGESVHLTSVAAMYLPPVTAVYLSPVAAVYLTPAGVTVTAPGDLNGDRALTPADLLCLYDPALPETWREGVRRAVAAAPPSDTGYLSKCAINQASMTPAKT